MSRSSLIAVVVVLLTIVWMGSGYVGPFATTHAQPITNTEGTASVEKPLPRVRIALSEAQNAARDLTIQGRTQADISLSISAQIDGRIKELMVDRGDMVVAGDILATIDVEDRRNRVREAEAIVAQRQLENNAARSLNQSGFQSKVRLAQTAAELETARANLERARVELAHTDITAPIDGLITHKMIEAGSYVDRGNDLFQVADLNPIKVIAAIPENQVNYLAQKQSARIRVAGLPAVAGTVTFIASQAEETTRTFELEVQVPNPDLAIKAGQTAAILLPVEGERAHKIPGSVLTLNDRGDLGVKTIDANNRVVFMAIEIVDDDPDGVWAVGLPSSVRLITVGQEFVSEGQEVEPVEEAATAAQIGQSLN
ncbi:MAG: efflux RND transporter periplasmic adaptor subunit [Pseudomonadota bacterium]